MEQTFSRVVTGHDSRGRAVIAMEGEPPTVVPLRAVPGMIFHEIWNTGASPARIDNGADPTLKPLQLQPPSRGSTIRVVDFPPDSVRAALSEQDAAAAFAEVGAASAGTGHASSRHHMMHRTQTIDYGIVLCGEMWLVLDEGEVRLRPGDIVVQRGTNHAWSNRTETTTRMVFILLDGQYADEIRPQS